MSNVTLIHVTPQLAKEWLCRNEQNRTLREAVVERYAKMMKSGEWTLTHQGIAFDTAGHLIDGQHRLAAILRSGKIVPLMVCHDVAPSAYPYIDGGLARTMADRVQRPKRHVEVVNFFFRIAFDKSRAPTAHETASMLAVLAPYLPMLDTMDARRKLSVISSAPLRAAAVYAAIVGNPTDEVLAIYVKLAEGNPENLQGLAAEFIRQLLTNLISTRLTRNVQDSGDLFFKVLPLFQRGYQQRKRFPLVTDQMKAGVRAILRQKFSADKCDSTPL